MIYKLIATHGLIFRTKQVSQEEASIGITPDESQAGVTFACIRPSQTMDLKSRLLPSPLENGGRGRMTLSH